MKLCFSAILHIDSNHLLGDVDRVVECLGGTASHLRRPSSSWLVLEAGLGLKVIKSVNKVMGRDIPNISQEGSIQPNIFPVAWVNDLTISINLIIIVIISRFYNTLSHTLVKAHDKVDY